MFTEHLLGDGPCGLRQSLAGGGDRPVNRRHIQFLLKTPCGQVWASASFPCSLVLAWLQLPCPCSALRSSPPPPTPRAPAPFGSLAPQLHSLSLALCLSLQLPSCLVLEFFKASHPHYFSSTDSLSYRALSKRHVLL